MVHITEEMVRQRAEHNDCEIFSLEEVSLHQLDITQIEHLDKWCKELKILYLQNNLIPRIENVSRLKKLQYINLALNNIEVIENLEACESLQKLDLTINFIGCLSSVQSLRDNIHFRELFLVGNPCAEFKGYRQYVVASLPQLKRLDGKDIRRSERILSSQGLEEVQRHVAEQEKEYLKKRAVEKEEAETRTAAKEEENGQRTVGCGELKNQEVEEHINEVKTRCHLSEEQKELEFWNTPCSFTPESRLEAHRHLEENRRTEEKVKEKKPKPPRRLIHTDGRVMNVNEAKLDFTLTEDEENNSIVLDLAVFRHMDTTLLDVDVQPTYVKVGVKGKIFQMVLPNEVKPDSAVAQRSQTSGHLVLTMPRANDEVKGSKPLLYPNKKCSVQNKTSSKDIREKNNVLELLEVDPSKYKTLDLSIVPHQVNKKGPPETPKPTPPSTVDSSFSKDFVDDPDVPPLT